MATVDLSAFEYILPILGFLIVFVVCFFLLKKSKLIGSTFWEIFISFAIAIVFASATGPRTYILTIIPWFAVAIIGLFLVMALAGFVGTKDFPTKGVGITFLVIMAFIFVITGFFVFSAYITPYLPGFTTVPGNPGHPTILQALSWLYSPRVAGALLLLGIGVVVSWVLIKAK